MDNVEKKYTKYDEVVKLVQEALKEPEHTGSYDQYIELCKLYDKNENGTMMLAELENFLSNLGKVFYFQHVLHPQVKCRLLISSIFDAV